MELHALGAVDLARLLRKREVSPVEVVDHLLERTDRLNPALGAYLTVAHDQARAEARRAEERLVAGEDLGPLGGVPVGVKDLTPTRGLRTTYGSLTMAGHVPDHDAVTVERLRRAGAIVMGKTNTPEFGFKGVTDNRLGPPARNPWNPERTAGGSSGGSAVAVAAGLAPLAEGTDGAGSIRIPAAFCGVVGFKPTYGRVPRWPLPDAWYSLTHAGPLARSVADAALMLEVLAGPDPRDPNCLTDPYQERPLEPGLRVAWSETLGYATPDPEVAGLTARAARTLAEVGCRVEPADPGFPDPEEAVLRIWCSQYAARLDLEAVGPLLDPFLVEVVQEGRRLGARELVLASQERTALWNCLERFYRDWDFLATPTMPGEAFPLGLQRPEGSRATLFGWTPYTYPFNLAGLPAITLPAGRTASGLPVGLQIVGRRGADAEVLRLAAAFERVQGGPFPCPPVTGGAQTG